MALSYDEPDALADYAWEHGVTFPLLSDPDSEIIGRFGILNTLIAPDDHPWYGIPFPGTYVTDGDGVIVAKFFESSLFLRPSAPQLLRAALGEEVALQPVERSTSEVTFDVAIEPAESEAIGLGILHDLVVRFAVPDGQHLYGEPVPDGMVATTVEFDDDDGIVIRPAVYPATSPHTLGGTGEVLPVFAGDVTIRVPFTHNGRSLVDHDDGPSTIRVAGTIRWQACDDEACHLPRAERFELQVPATRANKVRVERPEGSTGMDFAHHFARMKARRPDGGSRP